MAPPTAAGDRITEGLLYRFIPNLAIYWEYDRDRPSPRAFRLRPGEKDGVSMYLDGLTSTDRLEAMKPEFGIYSMRPEELLKEERVTIVYAPDNTLPEGRAHVVVSGINRRVAEKIAREIGRCVKAPAPAVLSLVEDHEEAGPPDQWRAR